MNSTEQSSTADSSHVNRKRRGWFKPLLALVVLLGTLAVGFLVGTDSMDPTQSEEYAALGAEKSVVEGERDAFEEARDEVRQELDEYRDETETREAELAERSDELDSRSKGLDERKEELDEIDVALAEREKAVGKAEDEKEANTVSNGVWTIGVDIKAGTYRSDAPVSSDCYWAVLKTGTNGDIIDNDIPGGGRPSVTVGNGQDLELSRCGTWTKQ